MNKFRDITVNKKRNIVQTVETSKGIVDFIPTFEKDDMVKVKDSYINLYKGLERLKNVYVTVDYCKVADLGDMVTEVVYLNIPKKNNTLKIQNPYLVEHFEKYEG